MIIILIKNQIKKNNKLMIKKNKKNLISKSYFKRNSKNKLMIKK